MANLQYADAATTLQTLTEALPTDLQASTNFIIGLDTCSDGKKIQEAYMSPPTEAWAFNALTHANVLMGYDLFILEDWEYRGEYDARTRCFTASFVARHDVDLHLPHTLRRFEAGHRLELAHSYKWNRGDLEHLLSSTMVHISREWSNVGATYCKTNPALFLQDVRLTERLLPSRNKT